MSLVVPDKYSSLVNICKEQKISKITEGVKFWI